MANEPENCPCCGAYAESECAQYYLSWHVECEHCGLRTNEYPSEAEAINAWNKRVIDKGNSWIPVSERLPDERINPYTKDFYVYPVLIQFVCENQIKTDVRYYSYGEGNWYYGGSKMNDYVKAWMPLFER